MGPPHLGARPAPSWWAKPGPTRGAQSSSREHPENAGLRTPRRDGRASEGPRRDQSGAGRRRRQENPGTSLEENAQKRGTKYSGQSEAQGSARQPAKPSRCLHGLGAWFLGCGWREKSGPCERRLRNRQEFPTMAG